MINRLPWRKKLRTSAANNLDKINEIVDYINHSDISPVMLSEHGSGRSVTVDVSSSLKSLTIHGESIQDGTPTPDAPVEVQVVEAPTGGQFGILIGDTVTPIDLKGNVLASLPDGTHDRLLVDSAGRVTLEKHVMKRLLTNADTWGFQYVTNPTPTNTSYGYVNLQDAEARQYRTTLLCDYGIGTSNVAIYKDMVLIGGTKNAIFAFADTLGITTANGWTAWVEQHPITLVYKLATPQTIDLGYIDMPTIESGDAISVGASIVPVIDVAWWCYDDVTDIIRDLKTYVDYKTADEQDPTAGLSMSRPANISLDTQAEQPAIIEESEMI